MWNVGNATEAVAAGRGSAASEQLPKRVKIHRAHTPRTSLGIVKYSGGPKGSMASLMIEEGHNRLRFTEAFSLFDRISSGSPPETLERNGR